MNTPNDLLRIAKDVFSLDDHEITYRTVTNRAYYAAYHSCKNIQHLLPISNEKKFGVHASLVEQLTKSIRYRSAGYMLNLLKGHRIKADYELDKNFLKETAEASLSIGESILDKTTL